jgi:gliding motility-associated-like protein
MQVFDFNAETGQLTNPVSFPVGEAGDMEIYPCPLLLYTGEENNFYQYDLRGGDAKAILRSKTLIAEKPDVVEGKAWPGLPSLQLGPDGKIYIGVPYSSDLHVIPRPGVVGTGCGFQPRAIDLQGGYVFQGLTCFMRSYLIPDGAPVVEMPNVFTPDGDQLNATFRPISLENVTDPQLSVYNRWGRLVHQSTGAQLDWDGKDHPAGTYYWLLLYAGSNTTDCGRRYSMKGFVSLIR